MTRHIFHERSRVVRTRTMSAATVALAVGLGLCVLCNSSSALEVSDENYVIEPYATYSQPGLEMPKHMTFDGDGNLYVTHTYSSNMWRIRPNGKPSEFLTGFQPAGVEWGGGTLLGDYLYVIECSTHEGALYRVDSNGQKTTVASWDGPRHGASALRLDRVGKYGGHLFVATSSQDRICKLPLNAQISDFSSFPGWLDGGGPGDIAFDHGELYEGLMYVSVMYSGENQHRSGVFTLDANGNARRFAKEIVTAGRMRFDPTGDFYGQLFVLGATGFGREGQLYRLAPDGTVNRFATAHGLLSSIVFGPDGSLFVAEYDKGDQTTIISRVIRKPTGHVWRNDVIDGLESAVLTESPGEFQVDYAGLRWDLMRTGWKVEDGKLASQRYARPGFQYGHSANGRNGLAITGIGDKGWVDYEVAFDFKMLPANQEFFHAHIPGDSRGMSVIFRAKSLKESWNQPHTCYSFGLRPSGKWSMGVSEDYYMPGHGWSATRKGKTEKLCNGTAEFFQDAGEGRLRLRVKGKTITVWLNGKQLVKHKHKGEVVDPIPYGGFGVGWRYESMGWISNLEVTKL
jgi:hypothetical protein